MLLKWRILSWCAPASDEAASIIRRTMRLALLIEYDGTGYHGFQRQASEREPTIQGALERAVAQIGRQPRPVIGAGRTDSGVHASGQVVHVDVEGKLAP